MRAHLVPPDHQREAFWSTMRPPCRAQGNLGRWWSAPLVGVPRCDEARGAVRAVPEVATFGRAGVSPESEGLGAVVSPAEAGEVVGVGLAGWAVGVVGLDVVEVAGPCVAG